MEKAEVMKRFRSRINNVNLNRFRSLFQIGAFLILIYGGYYLGLELGRGLPIMTCLYNHHLYGSGGCFFGYFQRLLTLPWPFYLTTPWGKKNLIMFLVFLMWFLFFNKAWCGYMCPLGTIQDWISKLRQVLRVRYSSYTARQHAILKTIKYFFLVCSLVAPMAIFNSFFGLPKLPIVWECPFCEICPGRKIVLLFIGELSEWHINFVCTDTIVLSSLGIWFTSLFLIGGFFKKRFFCLFCPMNALHHLFTRLAFLKLYKDGSKCTRCGNCYRVCDAEILEVADDVGSRYIVNDRCSMCFKCVAACPEEDCLKVTFLGFPIFNSTEEGFIRRQNIMLGNSPKKRMACINKFKKKE